MNIIKSTLLSFALFMPASFALAASPDGGLCSGYIGSDTHSIEYLCTTSKFEKRMTIQQLYKNGYRVVTNVPHKSKWIFVIEKIRD